MKKISLLMIICYLAVMLLPITAEAASSLVLPSGLLEIGEEAFRNDRSIQTVVLPESLNTIGANAFSDSSLQEIVFPDADMSIAENAFTNCSSGLTGVVPFGSYAHSWCVWHGINVRFKDEVGITPAIGTGYTDISITEGGTNARFRFIPDASGSYTISSSGTGDTRAYLYNEVGYQLAYDDDSGENYNFSITYDFTADTVYYFEFKFWNGITGDFSVLLAQSETEVNTPVITQENITVGETTAIINNGGDKVLYCFVPTKSGNYTFLSNSSDDPKAYLYNAAMEQLAYDDDGGDNSNFSITYDFIAGITYYFEVSFWNSTKTGMIPLVLRDNNMTFITSHPYNAQGIANQTVEFHVEAQGSGLRYQWQRKLPAGSTWENTTLGGNTTDTLSFVALGQYDGWQFRCVVTGSDGTTAYSNPASFSFIRTISLGSSTQIINNGGDTATVCFIPTISGSYTLTSSGEDDTKAYLLDENWGQLALSDDEGEGQNFMLSYSFTAGTVYYYQISYYDNSKTGSIFVTLSADFGPNITQQPVNTEALVGGTASFTVAATGNGTLTYQWQEKLNGSSAWNNTSLSGNRTRQLSFPVQSGYNRAKFRCIVTDEYGLTATSDEAMLYVLTSDAPKYRALLIAEKDFEGDQARPGNAVDVSNMNNMLSSVHGPNGGLYTIYGGNNEYLNSSPTEILDLISTCFADATSNDVSLFFISSHGVQDSDDASAGGIATVRTSPGRRYFISSNSWYYTEDMLIIDELATALKAVPGKVIVMINTCGSGAGVYAASFTDAVEEAFDTELFNDQVIRTFAAADEGVEEVSAQTGELRVSNKFYVLTSSQHKESSYGNEYVGAAFVQGIIQGVGSTGTMPADTNPADGVLTLRELHSYAYDTALNYFYGVQQHVQVYPENSSYELFIR